VRSLPDLFGRTAPEEAARQVVQALGAGRIVGPIAVVDDMHPDPSLLRVPRVHGDLMVGQDRPIGAARIGWDSRK
jgi:hypothetical protein